MRPTFIQPLFILAFTLGIISCKKDQEEFILTTNLTIANAIVDLPGVKVEPGRTIVYASESPINFGANRTYALSRNSTSIKIVSSTDSTAQIAQKKIDFNSGIYTMLLVGQYPNLDAMVIEEKNFPFIRTDKILSAEDSVVNVRFVNLSPNSFNGFKIKISGASANEVDNLELKNISPWKGYTARAATTNYVFQIRDIVTDALLGSYTLVANATNRFKNVTLAIKGLQGTTTGTNALGFMVINHF